MTLLLMIVCHCAVVSDRDVRAAIEEGANCTDALADACGAGAACGGCTPQLETLLAVYCPLRPLAPAV